jgi:hypothetical protein
MGLRPKDCDGASPLKIDVIMGLRPKDCDGASPLKIAVIMGLRPKDCDGASPLKTPVWGFAPKLLGVAFLFRHWRQPMTVFPIYLVILLGLPPQKWYHSGARASARFSFYSIFRGSRRLPITCEAAGGC